MQKIINKLVMIQATQLYLGNREAFWLVNEGFDLVRDDISQVALHVDYIDFDHPENNIFKVVNQYSVQGERLRRPDLLVFINGIPIAICEFKTAIEEDTTIHDAWEQITIRYTRDIPKLMKYCFLSVISDGANTRLGSIFTPYKFYYSWNKANDTDKVSNGISSLLTMIEGAFAKDRVLQILRDFIFYPDDSKKDEAIVCRYPQFFGAHKMLDSVREHMRPEGDGKGGTYFGATGCGKTYTMLFLSRLIALRDNDAFNNPTIVILEDREDLDTQTSELFVTAKKYLHQSDVRSIESREDMEKTLRDKPSGGVYITTIQKFCEKTGLLSDRSNIICISDEAHRTQTGVGAKLKKTDKGVFTTYGFAKYLRDSFPNATYCGFTGTPIDETMRMFIKQQILSGSRNNFAIIVPTKALINEVRTKTTEDLGLSLKEYRYHLVTAAGDAALKIDDKSRRYVFIMTPERLLYLLMNEKDIQLDYLFIDEAQKLSGDDTRSPFYYQVVQILNEAEQKPHIIFASPNVPNPQVYLNLISGVETETLNQHKLASGFSPVTQIKFLINLESKEVSVYNEHTKELMPITSVALQDAELTDVLLRFEKDDQGKEKQCIVYFSSVRKTVDAARDFAANRVAKTENAELIELAKDIKNEVHNDYYLAELVSKGVAYHIGYLPASIRQRIERLFHEGAITAIFCTSTLVEGVNLPADNLFITDFKNGLSHMSAIDFRNLIGRVGRLEYNLYGNVFLVAINEKASEKYVSRLQEEIPEQSLSVEKELTRPQKKHVIKTLLSGTIVIDKQLKSQSPDSYDLMRKFAIILLNDILKNRQSKVRSEFVALMQPGEEDKIRQLFSKKEVQPDDDITVSIDQTESLYEAITFNGLEFPQVDDNGEFDGKELLPFLERLCGIFKWERYESDTLGHVGKDSQKHGKLSWYSVILSQWVRGAGLNQIMFQAIDQKRKHPTNAMFDRTTRKYYDYTDTLRDRNDVISDVLNVIDKIILFKFSNYFLKVAKAYKEIRGQDPKDNWYEFVEYGSTNKRAIAIQKHGFSRESAMYILRQGQKYIAADEPELRLHRSILECPNKGVRNDADMIQYNIPDLFVD